MLKRWLVPLLLVVALGLVALWNPPLGWLAHTGSWLMVAAALALAWAVRQHRSR